MLQFIGSTIDALLFVGFGALVFFRPQSIAKPEGSADEIAKRFRVMKRCGAVMVLAGVGLLVAKLV